MNALDPDDDDALARRLGQALRALPDVPPALERAALGVFPGALRTAFRRLVAALQFDSAASSGLALGMRSLRGSTRHLLYSAEGRDVDLRIVPTGEAFGIAGQVLGPDLQAEVELDGAAGRYRGQLDGLGGFRIDGVAPGQYVLTLHAEDLAIELPAFDVGDGPR